MATPADAARYDPGLQAGQNECLCLHRNENLFVGPAWTVEAARQRLAEAALASYPDPACRALRQALAAEHGVAPENVFVGNGSDEVLAILLGWRRRRHDTLHLLDVCFKVYPMLAHRHDFRVAVLPGDTFETGRVEVADWTGLAVIDSPNAITGVRLGDEVRAALARDPRSFVIWDNVYGEYAGERLPAALEKNVVYVRSFSKFYGLASLRVGYCLADAAVVGALMDRKDVFNVNGFAQVMALEALRRKAEFEALAREMLACRAELVRRLRRLGFQLHEPAGHFVLATHPEHPGADLQQALLERRIAVRRFPDPPTTNHVRITVPPRPGLEQLTEALCDVLGVRRSQAVPRTAES